MTGIKITVEFSQDDARAGLRALLERLEDRLPFYKNVGDTMLRSANQNFDHERAPDGASWQKLKRSTIRARERRKQTPISILRAAGHLKTSLNAEASADQVEVGSVAEYAAAHQLGAVIQKAAGTRWMAGRRFARRDKFPDGAEKPIRAHQITIPARPFLGLSADDEDRIREDAEDWLMR